MRTLIITLAGFALLAGCARTAPVVVVTDKGQILGGTATKTFLGGSFDASDGGAR